MAQNDQSVIQDFNERYDEGYSNWSAFFPEAETDLRMYLGDQWTGEEKKHLSEEDRSAYVFNRIKPVVNLITGYQRQHRLASTVTPVEDSDQKTADQLSSCLSHVMSYGDGYRVISDCFGGAVKTGFNLASIWIDYRDDPINGDIRFSREPWNAFILDPYFTNLDLSDCAYILRRKYLSLDLVISLLPEREKELRDLHDIGGEKDNKFTWLPYQRAGSSQKSMAYNEYYEMGWEKQSIIVDMETGMSKDFDGDKELFARLKAINPSFSMSSRQKKFTKLNIIVNDELMEVERNPYGLNEYPFVPFISVFEPESDQFDLKIQSVIRGMRDPQRESNRRRSQMVDILESQINSGWEADEGSVVNPSSLFQAAQGKVIWKKKGSGRESLKRLQPAQIPQSMFQMQQQADVDIKEISGVNDAAFGIMESGNESGVLTMLRQGAALTNLQDIFDNLRFSQKHLSKLAVKIIQSWSPEKVQRLINDQPTREFYDNNFTKYDCVIQEGVLTDTQRQMYFRQLIDLKNLGAPVTAEQLARAAPIQGGSKYIEEIAEMEKQQAQAAQQQSQVEQELLQAQKDLATSQALLQVAGAKERSTRAIANLGLETERNSAAVQNRSEAVLDQVKAMKELEDMDLRTAKEELLLAEMLRRQNKKEEEELGAQNISTLEAAMAPGAPSSPAINQLPIGNENQVF